MSTLRNIHAILRSSRIAMATEFLARLELVRHSCMENLGQHAPSASPHFSTITFTCSLTDPPDLIASVGLIGCPRNTDLRLNADQCFESLI
jgi:hypothetical protein